MNKEILEKQGELEENRHKNRMAELEYERDSQRRLHEQILERGRITRAEERKILLLKEQGARYGNE